VRSTPGRCHMRCKTLTNNNQDGNNRLEAACRAGVLQVAEVQASRAEVRCGELPHAQRAAGSCCLASGGVGEGEGRGPSPARHSSRARRALPNGLRGCAGTCRADRQCMAVLHSRPGTQTRQQPSPLVGAGGAVRCCAFRRPPANSLRTSAARRSAKR
jgi:hypothetical protein